MASDHSSPAPPPAPFAVKDCALIAIATGKKALTLRELRDLLAVINPATIYYHFWGGLLQPRFEAREYNNDFATWASQGLRDMPLAERLAVIDPTRSEDLEELRRELLEVIEDRLDESEYLRWMPAARQFEFLHAQIVVFDTRRRLERPEELPGLLAHISASSVFYHFIDARRRLGEGNDDFCHWLTGFGPQYAALCRRLAGVDPYFGPLTALRRQLVEIMRDFFGE